MKRATAPLNKLFVCRANEVGKRWAEASTLLACYSPLRLINTLAQTDVK